jgi:signal transduction histidine kinase
MTSSAAHISAQTRPLDIYSDPQRTARIFTWFTGVILASQVAGIFIVLTTNNVLAATIIVISILPTLAAFLLIRRRKFEHAALFLALNLLFAITLIATDGLGIHHIGNFAYPTILIVASLVTNRRTMVFLTLFTIGCAAWLVFGELAGAFIPDTLNRSVPGDFLTVAIIIAVTAFMVRYLSEVVLHTNWRLQAELRDRKLAEEQLAQRAAELRGLYEASLDLNAQPDLDTLLRRITDRAARLTGLPQSSLYLLRPDGTLELVVLHDLPAEYLGVRLQPGEGLAGRVVQEGKPLTVEDYQHWSGRAAVFDRMPSRRVLSAPLRTRNHLLGALNVSDIERAGPFTEDEVRLVSLFADQAAVAIENAQLYEEAQARTAQLAMMNEIGLAVSALQDLDSVLELIYRQVQRIVPVDAFYICLQDAEREQISFPIIYDTEVRYHQPAVPLQPDTWIAQVVRTGQPFMLLRTPEEVQELDSRGLGDAQRRSASILLVPLWHGERVIGALSVQSYTLNAYTREHSEILTGVGIQAAIAIENAQLFTAAQQELAERRRVQAEREKLIEELEAKNAELERFTYTVSHDLKSPLVTIRGFLGLAEKDAQAGDLERMYGDFNRVREATDKMQRLLTELLELSRIGRLMNPPQAVPLETIAREALGLARGRIAAQGVQVTLEPGLPVVYGDRVRLMEVVQNLVDNAAKFMGDQPEPRITIGMRGTDADGKPIVAVQDNGSGIDPQFHEKIFGLFDKLDPKSEGTGVGLALVKRIVEVHGGRIWVESKPGQGATFCFTLPTPPGN